jgi:hypothetical protein
MIQLARISEPLVSATLTMKSRVVNIDWGRYAKSISPA